MSLRINRSILLATVIALATSACGGNGTVLSNAGVADLKRVSRETLIPVLPSSRTEFRRRPPVAASLKFVIPNEAKLP
jgi:hypothetical protein